MPSFLECFYKTPFHRAIIYWGVFLGGIFSIIVTRLTFNQYHSDWYDRTIPTISKAGALPPADIVFALTMGPVGLLIIFFWIEVYYYNKQRVSELPNPKLYPLWNKIMLFWGLAQGLSVSLMAIISLEMHNDLHIMLSISVFLCGAFVIIFESCFLSGWRRHNGQPFDKMTKIRRITAVFVSCMGLFFLYLFLEKGNSPFIDRYTTQVIYIINEHILAIWSFSYPTLLFSEINSFYKKKKLNPT